MTATQPEIFATVGDAETLARRLERADARLSEAIRRRPFTGRHQDIVLAATSAHRALSLAVEELRRWRGESASATNGSGTTV